MCFVVKPSGGGRLKRTLRPARKRDEQFAAKLFGVRRSKVRALDIIEKMERE